MDTLESIHPEYTSPTTRNLLSPLTYKPKSSSRNSRLTSHTELSDIPTRDPLRTYRISMERSLSALKRGDDGRSNRGSVCRMSRLGSTARAGSSNVRYGTPTSGGPKELSWHVQHEVNPGSESTTYAVNDRGNRVYLAYQPNLPTTFDVYETRFYKPSLHKRNDWDDGRRKKWDERQWKRERLADRDAHAKSQ